MPKIVRMTCDESRRFRNSPQGRRIYGMLDGEPRREQRAFLRVVLGARWRYRCAYCKVCVSDANLLEGCSEWFPNLEVRKWTDDHIICRSAGGDYSAGNIVPACRECNKRRGDRSLDAWFQSLGWSRVDVKAWWLRQRFPLPVLALLDESMSQIRNGCRFSNTDVEWMQALGRMVA